MRFLKFIPLVTVTILLALLIEPALSRRVKGSDLEDDSFGRANAASGNFTDPYGMLVRTRFIPPEGFVRTIDPPGSFAFYLKNLPLKPYATVPKMYNGRTVRRLGAFEAVVDLDIGDKNLHQCADAIIRLKAEYHFGLQQYDQIHFNFTNGFRVDYEEWMKGKRIVVKGNRSYWVQTSRISNTYEDLWSYLETVFMWAGTASLEKELEDAPDGDIRIGDILIQGGTPGHAMIIVDAAIHQETGEKVYLLAQSNMPAQEIQVVKNRSDGTISPWFRISETNSVTSGRWVFGSEDIRRFSD